jgi:hypothetical protein
MGDLQEGFDGPFIKRLRACGLSSSPQMEVLLAQTDQKYEQFKRKGLPTRRPNDEQDDDNATAIDWTRVCGNTKPHVMGQAIQEDVKFFIGSDHSFLCLELKHVQRKKLDEQKYKDASRRSRCATRTRTIRRKVPKRVTKKQGAASRLMNHNSKSQKSKVKQEKELLEQIQKVTAKETNKQNISGLEERVSELRKAIMNQANNMEYDREAGGTPTKHEGPHGRTREHHPLLLQLPRKLYGTTSPDIDDKCTKINSAKTKTKERSRRNPAHPLKPPTLGTKESRRRGQENSNEPTTTRLGRWR